MSAVKDAIRKEKKKLPPKKPAPPPPPEVEANGQAAAADPLPYSMIVESEEPFPDDARPPAFAGILGELIDAVDAHTEASRAGLLVQMMAAFGNVIGRTAYFTAERTRHYANLYLCIVGNTSKARKGTSWDRVRETFYNVDPQWYANRVKGGMSSGEGLIWEIRDPVVKTELQNAKGQQPVLCEVEVDKGEPDKRLLVIESEFGAVLRQFERQGNTLSMVLRQGWEGSTLNTMTKNSTARATDPHISIIGHITREELRRFLTSTEAANGLANRFLWVAVRRSKMLPEGGGETKLEPFFAAIRKAVDFARSVGEMRRDDEAREPWHEFYYAQARERPGVVGSLLARSEAQLLRLSCLYALLDRSCLVERKHLESAIALWDYCERSTAFLFGHSTGDGLADEILTTLRKARKEGVTRTDLYTLYSCHKSKKDIERALSILQRGDLAHAISEKTTGRPREVWHYGPAK